MNVVYKQKKMGRICSDEALIIREYGSDIGIKLMQRLSELKAATTLDEISYLSPQYLHPLKGNYKSCFSVHLTGNYRLIFEAYDDTDKLTMKKSNATQVLIRKVEDYHGN